MFDVPQEQYPTVIREMIRHENDVTNHRIMWLLVGQGFIANAYVSSMKKGASVGFFLSLAGILVTLSAFSVLFRSYQARAYLEFLGQQAKLGLLKEEHLPIKGWPQKRVKEWWRHVCVCPFFRTAGDLLEPWMFLPSIFLFLWLVVLLNYWTTLDEPACFMVGAILTALSLFTCCTILLWGRREQEGDF